MHVLNDLKYTNTLLPLYSHQEKIMVILNESERRNSFRFEYLDKLFPKENISLI